MTLHLQTVRSEVAIGESVLGSWLVCCQNFSMMMGGDDDRGDRDVFVYTTPSVVGCCMAAVALSCFQK